MPAFSFTTLYISLYNQTHPATPKYSTPLPTYTPHNRNIPMASSTTSSSLIIAVMLAVTLLMAKGTTAAVSCGQVVNTLYPCLTYVQYGGGIPATCCNGIRALNNAAVTTPDRQGVCSCLVSSLRGFNISPYSLRLAASLPAGCGVNLPYRIDPSIDCSKVR